MVRCLEIENHFTAWRAAALVALAEELPPECVEWRIKENAESGAAHDQTAFDYGETPAEPLLAPATPTVHVSKELAALPQDAALFRDPQRWAFLYKVLWRWQQGDRSTASPPTLTARGFIGWPNPFGERSTT